MFYVSAFMTSFEYTSTVMVVSCTPLLAIHRYAVVCCQPLSRINMFFQSPKNIVILCILPFVLAFVVVLINVLQPTTQFQVP